MCASVPFIVALGRLRDDGGALYRSPAVEEAPMRTRLVGSLAALMLIAVVFEAAPANAGGKLDSPRQKFTFSQVVTVVQCTTDGDVIWADAIRRRDSADSVVVLSIDGASLNAQFDTRFTALSFEGEGPLRSDETYVGTARFSGVLLGPTGTEVSRTTTDEVQTTVKRTFYDVAAEVTASIAGSPFSATLGPTCTAERRVTTWVYEELPEES